MDGLPRLWVSIQLLGTEPGDRLPATYVGYSQVPEAPSDLEGFDWLRAGIVREGMRKPDDLVIAEPTVAAIIDRFAPVTPPADLLFFFADECLVTRMSSPTDCYFDLADHARSVDGGTLVHLVSDSQWTMHWSIFVGHDGQVAIIASDHPMGFDLDEPTDGGPDYSGKYFLCADTFAEFVWRWWMDGEAFYPASDQAERSVTQNDYIRQYGEPQLLF